MNNECHTQKKWVLKMSIENDYWVIIFKKNEYIKLNTEYHTQSKLITQYSKKNAFGRMTEMIN